MAQWEFLTNHAHVLLCVARDSDTRLRHIAECVGITERATHRIICDLVDGGYLTKHRLGRRSYYEVHPDLPFRYPFGEGPTIGEVFAALLRQGPPSRETAPSDQLT